MYLSYRIHDILASVAQKYVAFAGFTLFGGSFVASYLVDNHWHCTPGLFRDVVCAWHR